tara:strand:+ start:819 stop:1055 length:237 start_codon:yes stop_codon:yes gene_type:complete
MKNLIRSLLPKAIAGPLTEEEARGAFNCLFEGDASNAQIAGFLIALRVRGESISEYSAAAAAMKAKATRFLLQLALWI